ncbi:MAG TPA: lipid A biosynthesis acyltransferase [Rhodanobacteraceae bacterium]|nr:lipid A biosynthesis acyltransferase [Rhodanobacteraceae bacterium]
MRADIALLYGFLRLAGLLPLRVLHALGGGIGWLLARDDGRMARHTAVNLALVRPDVGAAERNRLKRQVLTHAGRSLTEMAAIWGRSPAAALALVREVRGAELLDEALGEGRGVIIAAPHIGCWELLNYWLCSRTPMAILYRPPRKPAFEALLRRARGAAGPEQVRAEGAGVRTLYQRLAAGGAIGILPDQEPRRGEGRFAPFYGVAASTMVLLPRLARRTGARVLFSFAERLPRGRGFRIHLLPAPDGIADADLDLACAALNAGVQACADLAFTQYQWHYKRFRERPPGEANPYRAGNG